MPDYQNAKIYKIINTVNDKLYIGSTTQRLCDRMGTHRKRAKQIEQYDCKFHMHMHTIGIEHFKIILIKLFPCNSKDELEKAEFDEMIQYPSEQLLNDDIVYKKRSDNHKNKVALSQTAEKSVLWKFGSVFYRDVQTSDGYPLKCWVFDYKCIATNKRKRFQFSVKKYGDAEAKQLALNKQLEIYPESEDNNV